MIEEIFQKSPKRNIRELNIVPILDMLTTVIFFLLLSTSFMEYTKFTIPPSSTKVSTDNANKTPPLSPKIFLTEESGGLRVSLHWTGLKPGAKSELIPSPNPVNPIETRKAIVAAGRKLTQEFATNYPGEKTVQLGMGAKIPYQNLISLMDGVAEKLPDVVLISYAEVAARTGGNQP